MASFYSRWAARLRFRTDRCGGHAFAPKRLMCSDFSPSQSLSAYTCLSFPLYMGGVFVYMQEISKWYVSNRDRVISGFCDSAVHVAYHDILSFFASPSSYCHDTSPQSQATPPAPLQCRCFQACRDRIALPSHSPSHLYHLLIHSSLLPLSSSSSARAPAKSYCHFNHTHSLPMSHAMTTIE